MKKLLALALALTAVCSMGAELRTQNFVVIAANPQVCQSVGQWAEHYRKEKAIQWLGREMPQWSEPCPLHVTVAMDGPKGETEFSFAFGRVNSMRMKIHGPLDRLIHSVLPHEITHTVFANHFKTPVPRWADEGGSVLSEDDLERDRHDKLVRSILNKGQQIPMRTLLGLKEYPPQVMCLYAQGFSVCDYLVKRSNRQHFLNFVGHGMQHGWDAASKSYFGHNSVEELEQAWLQYLRDTKNRPQDPVFAANTNTNTNPQSNGAATFMGTQSGRTVRLTVPPAQPLDPPATTRGAMPTPDQSILRPGSTQWEPGVRLEAPVPIAIPRIPPISAVQASWPR
jgi:hypothetical protein